MITEFSYLFDNACKIDVAHIPVNKQLVDYCKMNACGKYSKLWTCPPAIDNYYESIYKKYSKACVLSNRYGIRDSFDWEGMINAIQDNNNKINELICNLKAKEFDFDLLKAGCCDLCLECTYPNKPCRHGDIAYPTLEACGIDVMKLSEICDIDYRPDKNILTYFNILFYNLIS